MFQGHEIRTAIKDDGSIWFVLNDVCGALGISNSRDTASRLRDNQKGDVGITDPLGGKQVNTIISESGLYSVILKSRSPRAEPFQEWIEDRVLPSIRKTGGYTETSMAPQDYEQAVEALLVSLKAAKRLEHERSLAVLQIEADRPKVEYFDEVLDASNGIEVTTIAQRYGLSAVALNKILEEHRVQYRMPHAPDSPWILHADYKGQGFDVMKTFHVGYGLTRQVLTWTEKGRHFIHQIMQERGY
jgi:prophage antirepressor-like protein